MLTIAAIATFCLTAIMAMAGVGAAFILVPIFLALGVEIHAAMATALLLNAISTSVSTTTFIRKRLVEWRLAVPILIVAVALSPVGVSVSQGLDRQLLLWMFSGFLIFASLMMLIYSPKPAPATITPGSQLFRGMGLGGVAGFVGGLLGVGGGSIIVPTLVGSGVEPKRASATASFVVVFASLTGFFAHATLSEMDYALVGVTGLASALGAALGAWLMSEKLKSGQLKYIIAMVLLATAIKIVSGLV
ncbi:sulfite exporter TauE/SafE family protein [Sedimenticola thiotaurini]|uniref:Probable membrane transporter protein n=1 Tax=Sedimenticola thiotaurini TaxID=1543721 RepID=A0A0F7K1D8_9GAMM|nr:sulfite exporter TauE/SafE family protein [Sedimenticola thiotaurini]AKH21692.1 membrane protein [Sedimenticola thiotaurini]